MSNEKHFHQFDNKEDLMEKMQEKEILCSYKAELLLVHYADGTSGFTINSKSPLECILEMTEFMIDRVNFEIETEAKGSR